MSPVEFPRAVRWQGVGVLGVLSVCPERKEIVSDLVGRLKKAANWVEPDFDVVARDLLEDAADEIERLRREVAELKCKLAMILSDAQGN